MKHSVRTNHLHTKREASLPLFSGRFEHMEEFLKALQWRSRQQANVANVVNAFPLLCEKGCRHPHALAKPVDYVRISDEQF